MARRKKTGDSMFTELELKVMQTLWELGPSTAKQVQHYFLEKHSEKFAYTTISTVLRLLEKKNAVCSKPEGRTHVYSPEVELDDYRGKAVEKMMQDLFSGNRSAMIKTLVSESKMSPSELEELRNLIEGAASD